MNSDVIIRLFALLALMAVFSSCNQTSTTEAPATTPAPIRSENLVHADAQRVEISPGNSGELLVRLSIDNGYHINANPPTYPYLVATQLQIPTADGLMAGSVSYPAALKKKFEFAEKELAVYEGEIELKTSLSAASTASRGDRAVAATLRVQACNHQVCYPPGAINLQIPVSIK